MQVSSIVDTFIISFTDGMWLKRPPWSTKITKVYGCSFAVMKTLHVKITVSGCTLARSIMKILDQGKLKFGRNKTTIKIIYIFIHLKIKLSYERKSSFTVHQDLIM